jgi:23S rRNA pseudouridine2605 synthase
MSEIERLQKILARAGLGSRRHCEELIEAGSVTINGRVATLGDKADAETDHIDVDGVRNGTQPGLVYYLLNKPTGVVTTAADTHGRPIVTELVPGEPRVFPIGRLDQDTEGLLLLTNDGDLAQRLAHPKFGVEKEYLVEVVGNPTRGELRQLREGIELDDGMTAPAKVALVERTLVRITIHEGRKRQVRRMCEAIGHPVIRLVRTKIGPLVDRSLAPGEWRSLAIDEVRALERAAGAEPS